VDTRAKRISKFSLRIFLKTLFNFKRISLFSSNFNIWGSTFSKIFLVHFHENLKIQNAPIQFLSIENNILKEKYHNKEK